MEPPADLQQLLDEMRRARHEPGDGTLIAWLPRLRAMARRHLPPHSPLRVGIDSEDLLQEGLLQLLRALDDFRGTTWPQFLAFVHAILSQKAVQQARRHAVREAEFAPAADCADLAGSVPTPSVDAMGAEDRARLRMMIERLPPTYRETLALRLTGLDNEQIAARLGLSLEALRQRLSRAVKLLQESW